MQMKAPPLTPNFATATGRELSLELARRYPNDDWVAALAKGAVMNRGDVERILQTEVPVSEGILEAAMNLEQTITPPDPQAQDDLFEAQTNARDAVMEVDGEAGLNMVPSPKPHPSRTNSPNEQGVRGEDYENQEI